MDGKEGKKYDGVWKPTFSPDSQHLAYVVYKYKGNKYFMVLDGKEGKEYDQIWGPTFTSDSQHIIYFVQKGDEIWKIVKRVGG